MMPIIDSSPAHHHHGHGHQPFYHQQTLPEPVGKMQLTLILPGGVPSTISVDANTPMMDLLVQAASSNRLNPSNYSLVILDSNQHVIHFKPNQTVAQIGSSTISLLPKEPTTSAPSPKSKVQPFEITVRLQVNLPDGQKILLRVDPTLPLYEIKEQICKQKKYADSNRYTLRLPNKLEHPLLLGLSLAEYKTKELTVVHLKKDSKIDNNEIQSFDRLYRIRSESQPPAEPTVDVPKEQEESKDVKQRPASVQLNPTRSPNRVTNVTTLPERAAHPMVTSHTSLHAYWNDPNFDTQSQVSTGSSTTKKRRAPMPPGQVSPNLTDQINQLASDQHHQSRESLTDSQNGTKQKRKAPIPPTPKETESSMTEKDQTEQVQVNEEQVAKQVTAESTQVEIVTHTEDEQRLTSVLCEQNTPPLAPLVITTVDSEQENFPPQSLTPVYSQIEKKQETIQPDSPYSTVKLTPTPTPPTEPLVDQPTQASPTDYTVNEIVQAGIAQPPSKSVEKQHKRGKRSPSTEGLMKIINDHQERAQTYQSNEKAPENVSYFRVAKSRFGKFETDNRGFVINSAVVFDQAEAIKKENPPISTAKTLETTEPVVQSVKTVPITGQTQSKGRKAYELLRKYEKEVEEEQQQNQSDVNEHDSKDKDKSTIISDLKEKSPTPIQLEVTERTTHISVTVESDRKQLITRASPIPALTSGTNPSTTAPPILAPKPFGKTITEYRTVRRMGADGETSTTTTVRTENLPSAAENNETLMESNRPTSSTENSS